MKKVIWYAHCVKATPGQLDQGPFYLYKAKEIVIDISLRRCSETGDDEWVIKRNSDVIAVEPSKDKAVASACYRLMDQSRSDEEHRAVTLPDYATHVESDYS